MEKLKSNIYSYLIISIIAGFLGAFIFELFNNNNDLYYNYYLTKTTIEVSPHGLFRKISKGDDSFILVDVRTEFEYLRGHIVGAINIPVYSSPNYGDSLDNPDQIVASFKKLKEQYPNKTIIIYCSSAPCKTGAKTGLLLAKNNIHVKILALGWNELRYYPNLYMKDIELKTIDMEKFFTTGPEPGVYTGPPIEICVSDSC